MKGLTHLRLEAVLLAGIALSGLGLHQANLLLEVDTAEQARTGEVGSLPDGKALHVLSLGFERLVADLFWLRTVYYVGTDTAATAGYPDAARLSHLVTDVDPEFHTVYVLMAGVLGTLRNDPEAAIGLLEKGTKHSEYWRIYFLLGFNHFMEMENYAEGARWIQAAAERGGPPYLPLLFRSCRCPQCPTEPRTTHVAVATKPPSSPGSASSSASSISLTLARAPPWLASSRPRRVSR